MFVPPPIQLSRAEIHTRLAARRSSNDENSSPTNMHARASEDNKSSLVHRVESPISPISPWKSHRFGDFFKRSPPPRKGLSPEQPVLAHGPPRFANDANVLNGLPAGFGESPRRAPVPPPKRPKPQDGASNLAPLLGAFLLPPPKRPIPRVPTQLRPPPPIPRKSPRRLLQEPIDVGTMRYQTNHISGSPTSGTGAMAESPLIHQSGVPTPSASVNGISSIASHRRTGSSNSTTLGDGAMASKAEHVAVISGVKGARIERLTVAGRALSSARSKHSRATDLAPWRIAGLDEQLTMMIPQRKAQEALKRRRNPETVRSSLQAPIHPVETLIYKRNYPNVNIRIKLPPPLQAPDKDLPETPTSILATPKSYYGYAKTARRTSRQKRKSEPRSPLAQVSPTDAKSNRSLFRDEEISPSRLSAIPEHERTSGDSPLSSGMSTPVATHMHLRGGSVVTVSPPELSAWQWTVYVQGPIKLPKPAILPRKDSIASLEPFQDAIDAVYQDALNIRRRQSDDQVMDDVCEFFDDFGFDQVRYEADTLAMANANPRKESEGCIVPEFERFSTPPVEPTISPVEKVVAEEVAENMSKMLSSVPPVENEETLRKRGIARLLRGAAQRSQRDVKQHEDSNALSRPVSGVLPLLPPAEEYILSSALLDEVLRPSRTSKTKASTIGHQQTQHGDDVEELDPSGFAIKKQNVTRGNSTKIQRVVATASAFL